MDLSDLMKTYGTWGTIVILALYLAYQILSDYFKNKKDKIKSISSARFQAQLSEQLSKTAEVNNEILKYLKVVYQEYADEITESQARIISDYVFEASRNFIYNEMYKIETENHIHGNEKETKVKIKQIINNRFLKDTLSLKEYKTNKRLMSEFINPEWKEILSDKIIDVVIQEKGDKTLESTIYNSYESFKGEFQSNLF